MKLGCRAFKTEVVVGQPVVVHASFIVKGVGAQQGAQLLARALERLALYLGSGDIELVLGQAAIQHCFYCGVSQRDDLTKCLNCNAPLGKV